ncbi:glycosyltransferase family 2 protein, partial [Brachyspira murdochii]
SIVIPFYNRIEYTLESIESIKKQTHSNWELILINDSSTEDISKINKLCDGKKIKLYNNTYGKGVSTARNLGMDIADGDYLIFLDSDDIFIETKIEKSIKYMLLMGADFSATSYTKFFENSTRENIPLSTNKYHIEKNIELSPSFVTLSKKIYQNKEYRFNKEFENGEDVFLFMKISKDYILFHLPEYLTLFRIL